MFTYPEKEYLLLAYTDEPSPMERIVQYHEYQADIVNKHPMKYLFPEISVKSFIDKTMKHFANNQINKESVQKEISEELWKIQENISQSVFAEIDSYDPDGFLELFGIINGAVIKQTYLKKCLENEKKRHPDTNLFPVLCDLMEEVNENIKEMKSSLSEMFLKISELYDRLPDKIKQCDLHWKKLYMFALYPDFFDVVDALQHIEVPKGGITYITDAGNTYMWNETEGILGKLIVKRLDGQLPKKKIFEPFEIAFGKTGLADDTRKEISQSALQRFSEIETKIDEYISAKKNEFR
jgi:hypothetical protein